MKRKWIKRTLIILGVMVAVLAVAFFLLRIWLFPSYEEPEATGSYTVKTKVFTWEDESRRETFTDTGENRILTIKFWYPEKEGNYPLVVFSHGAFGVIDSNHSTYMDLASNGYVVASIGHTYHAVFVEDVNGKITIGDMDFVQQVYGENGADAGEAEKRVYEFGKEWMGIRTGDINFVLNIILNKAGKKEEEPFTLVDVEKIGLFGHSMGGAAVVQIGRERRDIDAVLNLEGTMSGEYVGFDDEKGYEIYNENPYPVPLVDINSKAVRDQIAQLSEEYPGWEYVNDYVGRNAVDYREVVFADAGHMNFTDLPMLSPVLAGMLGVGEVDPKECITNVNEVVRTFFDYYLKSKGTLESIQAEY